MLTLLFIILMIAVFGKVIGIAIKAAWGLTKVLVTIVFLPIILIVMAVSGFMTLAVIALIIGGIIALITSALV